MTRTLWNLKNVYFHRMLSPLSNVAALHCWGWKWVPMIRGGGEISPLSPTLAAALWKTTISMVINGAKVRVRVSLLCRMSSEHPFARTIAYGKTRLYFGHTIPSRNRPALVIVMKVFNGQHGKVKLKTAGKMKWLCCRDLHICMGESDPITHT